MRVLVLDNYDSFTWNLVQDLGALGAEPRVVRNDAIDVASVIGGESAALVISPGPGTPDRAGIAVPLARAAAEAGLPLLGVCLGHQALARALGGTVARADRLMHGKVGSIRHDGTGIMAGLPDPLAVMRYHSLVVAPDDLPADLRVTAWSADRPVGQEVMAVAHRTRPAWGVQFHPESVATEAGRALLGNFLELAREARAPVATAPR